MELSVGPLLLRPVRTEDSPVLRALLTDLLDVLVRHRARQPVRVRRADAPFLSDRHGRAISRQTAELVFKRVREQAGLERPARSAPIGTSRLL
jgi:hypothetical protein